eukprot:m.253863 g.253863  ORF g.253863 m.253863 type:complete len:304 (+) comp15490_c0_seq3:40-951(+)
MASFALFLVVLVALCLTTPILGTDAAAYDPPCSPTSGTGCKAAVQPCDSTPWNAWHWTPGPNLTSLTLRGSNTSCLNVIAWGTQVGDTIWTTECHDEEPAKMLNRQWILYPNGSIVNPTAGLCLDAPHGTQAVDGELLQLSPCETTAATHWKYNPDTLRIEAKQSGMCVVIATNQDPPQPPPPPPPSPPPFTATASITINTTASHASTSDAYVSFNFDWHKDTEEVPVWINMSVQKIDLSNDMLLTAVKALAPAHLRVGGSEVCMSPCVLICLNDSGRRERKTDTQSHRAKALLSIDITSKEL